MRVQEQGLSGTSDIHLTEVARQERACVVTLDRGFADIFAFPPHNYYGIVVLRHPKPTVQELLGLVEQLGQVLWTYDPTGKLWIVEPGRLRVHELLEPEDKKGLWEKDGCLG